MKLKYIIIILLMISTAGYIVGNSQMKQTEKSKSAKAVNKEITIEKMVNQKTGINNEKGAAPQVQLNITTGDGHANLPLECKSCHACDFPTKRDPCLLACPRSQMISIEHKPEEGPNVVKLNANGKQYGKVVFSHKIHAQMADISIGCEGCHHYNTNGPIEKCSKCHEPNRKRNDISRPDLKGAMHRQCFTCHRQWSHANDCSYCHLPMSKESDKLIEQKVAELSMKDHPESEVHPKIVYDTKYPQGKKVTFYHDEHIDLFGYTCKSCHQNDNCSKCHDKDVTLNKPKKRNLAGKPHEEIHKNCTSCHKNDACSKCHTNSEKERFNHKAVTGFDLTGAHAKLACAACHGNQKPIKKVSSNCTSCHKDFVSGKFKHEKTGLKLNELHVDFDCTSCHPKNNFSAKPVCAECHDGYTYPKQKPGNLIKK